MTSVFPFSTALLVAATMVMTTFAQGSTAKGTIVAGKSKVTIAAGMAVGYRAPNGQLISVLLSDKPPDLAAFARDTRVGAGEPLVAGLFEGAWKSQHFEKRLSGFVFTIDSNGRILSEEFLIGGQNNTFMIGDEYLIELTSTSPRLVGRLRTKTPAIDIGQGRTAGVDVTFDLPVAATK